MFFVAFSIGLWQSSANGSDLSAEALAKAEAALKRETHQRILRPLLARVPNELRSVLHKIAGNRQSAFQTTGKAWFVRDASVCIEPGIQR
jgi:hypothetical protein